MKQRDIVVSPTALILNPYLTTISETEHMQVFIDRHYVGQQVYCPSYRNINFSIVTFGLVTSRGIESDEYKPVMHLHLWVQKQRCLYRRIYRELDH